LFEQVQVLPAATPKQLALVLPAVFLGPRMRMCTERRANVGQRRQNWKDEPDGAIVRGPTARRRRHGARSEEVIGCKQARPLAAWVCHDQRSCERKVSFRPHCRNIKKQTMKDQS
jgi:hypothetical protein